MVAVSDDDVDLPQAPPTRWWERVRRWWRSRGRHGGLRYWLSLRGAPILLGYAALYLANGLLIGWRQAYEVNIGITSPAATGAPVAAWFLSVTGWLVVPGVAGAIAAYVVNASIESRRTRRLDRLFGEGEDG